MVSIPESADVREGVHTPRQVQQPGSPESEPTQYESPSPAPLEATTPGVLVLPPLIKVSCDRFKTRKKPLYNPAELLGGTVKLPVVNPIDKLNMNMEA